MLWYSLFCFFWVAALIIASTQYVLIVAVASWYFTENTDKRGDFSICRGYWWTFRYNAGSLMFGSFLIALVWMIRVIFEYLQRKIVESQGGQPAPPIQFMIKCMRCCIDCCHRFIKYINENAYC